MENSYKTKMESFYKAHKRMPTYSEMMKLFGFGSKNAVFKLVKKMIDAGIVAKDHLGRLIPAQSFGEIPMLGLVKAGFPSDAEEVKDTMDLNDFLVEKKEDAYLLRVDGDSMIDAHIEEGDMVLVEKSGQAKNGDIVIAEVDGEFTMKYLREKNGKRWLEPANPAYRPIYPEHSLHVIARVKAVIRKY
jgi:SOS regulatory protein LexA